MHVCITLQRRGLRGLESFAYPAFYPTLPHLKNLMCNQFSSRLPRVCNSSESVQTYDTRNISSDTLRSKKFP